MTKDETEEERKPLLENSNGIISQCANNNKKGQKSAIYWSLIWPTHSSEIGKRFMLNEIV